MPLTYVVRVRKKYGRVTTNYGPFFTQERANKIADHERLKWPGYYVWIETHYHNPPKRKRRKSSAQIIKEIFKKWGKNK